MTPQDNAPEAETQHWTSRSRLLEVGWSRQQCVLMAQTRHRWTSQWTNCICSHFAFFFLLGTSFTVVGMPTAFVRITENCNFHKLRIGW